MQTPCGLDIPRTFALAGYPDDGDGALLVGTHVVGRPGVTVSLRRDWFKGGDELDYAKITTRYARPDIDWLAYHDQHCDCRRNE